MMNNNERLVEVVNSICEIKSTIAKEVFKYQVASDCFCPNNKHSENWNYEFSDRILDFVKDAVREKIESDRIEVIVMKVKDNYNDSYNILNSNYELKYENLEEYQLSYILDSDDLVLLYVKGWKNFFTYKSRLKYFEDCYPECVVRLDFLINSCNNEA